MRDPRGQNVFSGIWNERNLSVLVHSLFSAWMLALLFEGRLLYCLLRSYGSASQVLVFGGMAAVFLGLLFSGFFIKTKQSAKLLFLRAYPFFVLISLVFFFPPSFLWTVGIFLASFLAGLCTGAWGFYLQSGTAKKKRLTTVADMLILSNFLMILVNTGATYISPRVGLVLSLLMLVGAFFLARKLPEGHPAAKDPQQMREEPLGLARLLGFLYVFIVLIAINSGLMYEVTEPAFARLERLTTWYWALPYIAALFVVKKLPQKTSRGFLLYVAIAMIGLSFIGFVVLSRSAPSYFIVNTLMMGACGIYDLFWWSILGEMLEFRKNPALILGVGLSANVLGVLLGGVVGGFLVSNDFQNVYTTLLALVVVCLTLALLPFLHKHLSLRLKDHSYLTAFSEIVAERELDHQKYLMQVKGLSPRERQVASRLLQGKTYRVIAGELFISENTVKYYVKNIYGKFNIRSRAALIEIVLGKDMGSD